jgi:hypothetical protein
VFHFSVSLRYVLDVPCIADTMLLLFRWAGVRGLVTDFRCFSFWVLLSLLVLQWTIALSPPPYWCTQCGGSHSSPTHWRFYYWGCWQRFGGAGAKRSCYCILQWVDYPDERRRSFVATHPEGEVWQAKQYLFGKFANCNTGNAIATLITITGMVVRKTTIPVLLSWHIKTLPVW